MAKLDRYPHSNGHKMLPSESNISGAAGSATTGAALRGHARDYEKNRWTRASLEK